MDNNSEDNNSELQFSLPAKCFTWMWVITEIKATF